MLMKNFEDDINRILYELPSENEIIDYKQIPYKKDKFADCIKDIIGMLNSEEGYNKNKYIIFGVTDSKERIGLKVQMPDDNEFQNLAKKINPRPKIQTGKIEFEDNEFGYLKISSENNSSVYEVKEEYKNLKIGQAFIRRASCNEVMTQGDRQQAMKTRENFVYIDENISKEQEITHKNSFNQTLPKESVLKTIEIDSEISLKDKNKLRSIMIALIIGEWNEKNAYDKKIIEEFSGLEYEEWVFNLHKFIKNDAKSKFKIENRKLFFDYIKNDISFDDIDLLRKICEKVFLCKDINNILYYSEEFKLGICESIAIISYMKNSFSRCSNIEICLMINRIVYDIMVTQRYDIWENIGLNMIYVAQASPIVFLDTLQRELNKENSLVKKILYKRYDKLYKEGIWGLVYALKCLAWSQKYFCKVCLLLGQMLRYNKEISKHLTAIFLPWYPQTEVCSNVRIFTAQQILQDEKMNCYDFLFNLLPYRTKTTSDTKKPEYILGDFSVEKVTIDEFNYQSEEYLNMTLDLVEYDDNKIIDLIDILDCVNSVMRNNILKKFKNKSINISDNKLKYKIWDKLLSFINKHRNYYDADWALNEQELMKIEEVTKLLTPKDKKIQYSRLFKQSQYDLLNCRNKYDDEINILNQNQINVIKNLFHEEGLEGIIKLSNIVDMTKIIGKNLAKLSLTSIDENKIVKLFISGNEKEVNLAKSYIVQKGLDWIYEINIFTWSYEKKVELLVELPFKKETWELVSIVLKENQYEYWKNTTIWLNDSDYSQYAIDWLIKSECPQKAIILIDNIIEKSNICNQESIFKVLDQYIKLECSGDTMSTYYISNIIKWLQCNCNDKEKVAMIELAYFDVLVYDFELKVIFKYMLESSEFFIKIICILDDKEDDIDKLKKMSILDEFNNISNIVKNSTFNEIKMKRWIEEVEIKSKEKNIYNMAMELVGKILFYTPSDSSGFFINKSIAEILNKKESHNQRNGYKKIGLELLSNYNVNEWEERAIQSEMQGYIHFAIMLRDIANSYLN